MTCVSEKKGRTYKVPPDVWPKFEEQAARVANDVPGGFKGDVVALAMRLWMQVSEDEQRSILMDFRDRDRNRPGVLTPREESIAQAITDEIAGAQRSAKGKRKKG